MRYLLIFLALFLAGCSQPKFDPPGDRGRETPYFYAKQKCDICKNKCAYFKVMNKKKIVCADCYEKKYR
jgi:PBP1b-binding outer membrane lipoprotein LpoB